jgi:hypothetical protein
MSSGIGTETSSCVEKGYQVKRPHNVDRVCLGSGAFKLKIVRGADK